MFTRACGSMYIEIDRKSIYMQVGAEEFSLIRDEELDNLSFSHCFRCDCGVCHVMDTAPECVCCHEFDIMDEKRAALECITLHEGFVANCLNKDVLEVSLYEYVEYEGPLDDNVPMNE